MPCDSDFDVPWAVRLSCIDVDSAKVLCVTLILCELLSVEELWLRLSLTLPEVDVDGSMAVKLTEKLEFSVELPEAVPGSVEIWVVLSAVDKGTVVLGIVLKLAVLELLIELRLILCDIVELSRELCVVISIEDVVLEIFVAVPEFSVVDPALEILVVGSFLTPDIEDEATSVPVPVVDSIIVEEGPASLVVSIPLVDINVLELLVGDAVVLSAVNIEEDPASLVCSDVNSAIEEVPA